MNTIIVHLDDRTAVWLLDVIIRNSLEPAALPQSFDPELREALEREFATGAAAPPVSEGELARAALQLLAADPELEPRIVALAAQSRAEQFDLGLLSGAAVLTLALSVLQTQADLSWDKKNGLRIAVKKRAASDSVLRQFLAKFMNFKS